MPAKKGRPLKKEGGPNFNLLQLTYPKLGFLPLLAFLERQFNLPLRLRFPMIIPLFNIYNN